MDIFVRVSFNMWDFVHLQHHFSHCIRCAYDSDLIFDGFCTEALRIKVRKWAVESEGKKFKGDGIAKESSRKSMLHCVEKFHQAGKQSVSDWGKEWKVTFEWHLFFK